MKKITTRQSTILVLRSHATKIKDENRIILFKSNKARRIFFLFQKCSIRMKSSDNVIVLLFVYENVISKKVMLFMITMSQKNLMTNRNPPTLRLMAPKISFCKNCKIV